MIATHSPIVLAYPDAVIYECSEDGLSEIEYEQASSVRLFSGFLSARERFLAELLSD